MIPLDSQGRPFSALDTYDVVKCAPSAFSGGTTNARGDDGGTNDPFTLFKVTGDVAVRVFGVCTVNLVSAGGGTLQVGITGNTALLLPLSTSTDFVANDFWVDNSPAEVGGGLLSAVPAATVLVNGLDIIETVGTSDITAGNIYYICLWRPLSPDGLVMSAV